VKVGVTFGVGVKLGVTLGVGVKLGVILGVGVGVGVIGVLEGVCEGLGTLSLCSLTWTLFPVKTLILYIPCPGTFNLLPANILPDFFLEMLPMTININDLQITNQI
jgi:hypothetical protein